MSEIDLGSGLSHEEIEGALGALLEEREKEIVEYLIDDVSGRSKKLKKRLAYLEIDWSEYD